MTIWIFIATVLLSLGATAVIAVVLSQEPRTGRMKPYSAGLEDARYRRNRAWDAAVTRARNRHSKAA